MAPKAPPNPVKLRKETREWLATHTIEDVREIASTLENAGEDVTELWKAIDDLETVVNAEPSSTGHRVHTKVHA